MAQAQPVLLRAVIGFLWLVAGWALAGFVAAAVGASPLVGPVVGIAAAALVQWDPTGRLWPPRPDRQQIRRRIAELERVTPEAAPPHRELDPTTD